MIISIKITKIEALVYSIIKYWY